MKTSLPLLKLAVCCAASVGLSLLSPQIASAQTPTNNALEDLDPQQNRNPFSSRDDGDAINGLMDIMHRAQMGNIRSASEYSAEQDRSLNDAAAQFRQRQLEMIRNRDQNQVQPTQAPQVAK